MLKHLQHGHGMICQSHATLLRNDNKLSLNYLIIGHIFTNNKLDNCIFYYNKKQCILTLRIL